MANRGLARIFRGFDPTRLAMAVLAAIVFAAHATWGWSRWLDDAFITFRYADRFAGGEGMTFDAGEHVEGITNLGWAIFLSWFAPGDPLLVAKIGGLGAGVVSVFLLAAWCTEFGIGLLGTFTTLASFVLIPWAPLHAVTGLETAAAMAFATAGWSLAQRGRGAYLAALAMGVGPWIRPDLALVPIGVALFRWRGPARTVS